jgi:hypothetical protein
VQVHAGGGERVDAELVEPRARLVGAQQLHLAELARVAEEDVRTAVGEAQAQMRVHVGREPRALLLRRERGLHRGREQPWTAHTGPEQLAGHAQVQEQPALVVEVADQVLAAAFEPLHPPAVQLARERCGRREEEVAPLRGDDLHDRAADQQRLDLTARDFDLRQLGHRPACSSSPGRTHCATPRHRRERHRAWLRAPLSRGSQLSYPRSARGETFMRWPRSPILLSIDGIARALRGGAMSVLVAACGASSPAESGVLRPPDNLKRDEHAGEVGRYRRACDDGSAEACGYLGFMYDNGFGVPSDIALAVDLCERACADGAAYGCAYLGYLHRLGRGVPQDDARAATLFRRACDDDDLDGCMGLAIMYKSGSGVPRDLEYAARLFRRACDRGEALACYSLGYMYANGEGVDRDLENAGRLFRSACESGDRVGCAAADQLR